MKVSRRHGVSWYLVVISVAYNSILNENNNKWKPNFAAELSWVVAGKAKFKFSYSIFSFEKKKNRERSAAVFEGNMHAY